MADRASTNRIVDVGGPKVGPQKLRLNNRLADVAPELAREPDLAALSRQGLQAKVAAKLEEATANLDDASDSRLVSQQVKTAPLLASLDAKIADLTSSPVEADRVVPAVQGGAAPVREVPVDPIRQYALRWIKDDMESLPFTKHTWNDLSHETGKRGNAGGGGLNLVPGSGGAPIYQALVGTDFHATRAQVISAIDDVLKGNTTGPLRERIASVADDLAKGDRETQKLMVTSGPFPTDEPLTHVTNMSGKEPATRPGVVGRPLGQAVQPGPNKVQIGTLKQIRDEVAALGPVAPYEAVRRIRQAWDQVAKVKYSPAMSPDFLAKQGEATAAMKGTGAIRDALSAADPQTAAANAQYSLYKTANDVLQATEETERARPRVLRGIVARTGGAMVGAEAGGMGGAVVGTLLGSVVERVAELAPTAKILIARQLASVADLLRGGNVQQATTTLRKISSRLPAKVAGPFGQEANASAPQAPQQPRAASR